ncbi:hypothetical protein PFISCL1PPCAC_16952, partial [Pristionchus fissidentatus]
QLQQLQQPHTGVTAEMSDKLDFLHREMANLRMECDRLISKHEVVKHSLNQTGPSFDTPSSAYNTGGESCRSLTPEGLNCVECQSCLNNMVHNQPPHPSSALPPPFRVTSPLQQRKRYGESPKPSVIYHNNSASYHPSSGSMLFGDAGYGNNNGYDRSCIDYGNNGFDRSINESVIYG